MGENNRMRKNGEIFLSCTPEGKSLATPLVAIKTYGDVDNTSSLNSVVVMLFLKHSQKPVTLLLYVCLHECVIYIHASQECSQLAVKASCRGCGGPIASSSG